MAEIPALHLRNVDLKTAAVIEYLVNPLGSLGVAANVYILGLE